MWHPIAFVAESRFVDAEKLNTFAKEHSERYRIVSENGENFVSTWDVDRLVKDALMQGAVTRDPSLYLVIPKQND